MRQKFDVRGGRSVGLKNLPLIRAELANAGLDGIYLPHEDEYQNEYQPAANQRLSWATGFTGSAGAALLLKDRAIVYVDGRYTIQAEQQLDPKMFETESFTPPGPFAHLESLDLAGMTIGYDPKVLSSRVADRLKSSLAVAGAKAKPMARNVVDKAWAGRPRQPMAPLQVQDISFSGEASGDKRERLGKELERRGLDCAVITSPASLAWLFNIRGGDVACTPLPLGRALLHADGRADLFVAPKKVSDDVREHLGNEVVIRDIKTFGAGLRELSGKSVLVDPGAAPEWVTTTLKRAKVDIKAGQDPCELPKATKNAVEIAGSQRAHERDGVAICHFLHWLETGVKPGETTEIDAVKKLERFREATGALRDISFETISGAGPNGAIVHYRVSEESNRTFENNSLFLVDSGGQYKDGTTDITRTVVIGEPTDDMKRHYTLVLKGVIALTVARFPKGTTGTHLDVLARHALWQAGLDYQHGTGHGVGSYLGVHEGPQRIAKVWAETPLDTGMIVSNEPGYYKTGAYGIRIENLQYVTDAEHIEGGELPMYGFTPLTLAPLDRRLIDVDLLTDAEKEWVNAYHKRVADTLSPRLSDSENFATWLEKVCAPI